MRIVNKVKQKALGKMLSFLMKIQRIVNLNHLLVVLIKTTLLVKIDQIVIAIEKCIFSNIIIILICDSLPIIDNSM